MTDDRAATTPSRLRRFAGLVLILSSLVGFIGQGIALARWEGVYTLSSNLTSDLGFTECQLVSDSLLSRYVCSPGHAWFNGAQVLSGVLALAGAVLLGLSLRPAAGTAPRGSRVLVPLLGLAGLGVSAHGLLPADRHAGLNGAASLALALVTFAAMLAYALSARSASSRPGLPYADDGPAPLAYGPFPAVTWVFLAATGVGFLLFLLGVERLGLWERLVFDGQAVWIILIGIAFSRGGPSSTAVHRRSVRQREKAARDAAIIEAAQASQYPESSGHSRTKTP